MQRADLDQLRSWFSAYCRSFPSREGSDPGPYAVKEAHTRKVCADIARIAQGLSLDDRASLIAEAAALFHDIGRFPQYEQYGTFRDSASVNHAALGAKVLLDEQVLAALPQDEQNAVIHAVTLHNVFSLPPGLDSGTRLFAQMVRDADKLDIWRIFVEYYDLPEAERSAAIGLGLPDSDGFTPGVLACLDRGEMVRHDMIASQNDFKLLQLSWVYDLNFAVSFRILADRRHLERLAKTLPMTGEVRRAVHTLQQYVDERMR